MHTCIYIYVLPLISVYTYKPCIHIHIFIYINVLPLISVYTSMSLHIHICLCLTYTYMSSIHTYMFRLHMCGGVWGKTHMYIQKHIYVFARHRHICVCRDIHTRLHIHRKSSLYLPCRFSQLSIEIPGATMYLQDIDIYVYAETYTLASIFIGKVVFICLVGSVNSVLKFLGQPGETRFQPGGDEISSGVPMTFNTKLTEPKGK